MLHNPCFLICGVAAVQWRELEDQRFLCTPIRCSKSQRAVNQAVAIFVIVIVVVLNHLLHPPHPQTAAQSEASQNCDFIFVLSVGGSRGMTWILLNLYSRPCRLTARRWMELAP